MIITIKQCLDFNKVYDDLRNTKMPFQTSYHLFLLKTAMDEHTVFYAKQMQSLAAQYSENAPEASVKEIKISKEKSEDFLKKADDLLALRVEVLEEPINPKDLSQIELSIEQIEKISFLIKREQVIT